MTRSWLYGAALSLLALPAIAGQPYHPAGTSLSLGNAAHPSSVKSLSQHNPSAASGQRRDGISMGIFGIGFGYEIGPLDDFDDLFTGVEDSAEELSTTMESINGDMENSGSPEEALDALLAGFAGIADVESSINDVLDKLAKDGYVAVSVMGSPPIVPLTITHDNLRGTLTVGYEQSVRGRLSILHKDPIATGFGNLPQSSDDYCIGSDRDEAGCDDDQYLYNTDTDNIQDPDDETISLDALDDGFSLESSGAYIQTAYLKSFSLGFGREVWRNYYGILHAGGRLNRHSADLSRTAVFFSDDPDSSLQDSFKENTESSDSLGADIGVLWTARYYQLGASISNLIEPRFDYPAIPRECDGNTTCELLNEYVDAGILERRAQWVMERQLTLEAAAHSDDGNWHVGMSYDVNPTPGPAGADFGDEFQWFTLGATFDATSLFLPALRLGYRKNMAGSELSYVTAGTTLFGGLNVDLAMSNETVDSSPRSYYLNIGARVRF